MKKSVIDKLKVAPAVRSGRGSLLCKINRRDLLKSVGAYGALSALSPSLWAAMKYDREAVVKLFRLHEAEVDARVKEGVEANRKGPMTLVFKDTSGKALENVHIKVVQKTHDFRYGADLFMLDEIVDSKEKNEAYKEHFAAAFNLATLPFYWRDLEPEQGKPRYAKDSPRVYRRPPTDLAVEWCEAHGIEPKEHCLNYPNFTPDWVKKDDVEREKVLLEKRFKELAERYSKRIRMWEVTNEHFWGPGDRRTDFYSRPDFVEWSFKTAEKYLPGNELIINEAHCRVWNNGWFKGKESPYFKLISDACEKGARIDSIGLQFHMFHGADMANVVNESKTYYDPRRLFDVMDAYASFGKPLQITEITIPAYSNDPGDEAVQAEILRTLYRIWFSHPAMKAIIYWNLPDGYAYGAEPGDMTVGENIYYGGLCRFDMTPKPAYHVVKDLFGREWRTNFERDVGGEFAFRGFKGDYELEATSNGKVVRRTFHIGKASSGRIEVAI